MANHAYLGVRLRDTGAATPLERFERFLAVAPQSAARPGFSELVVRAIGPAEIPLIELDLRALAPDAAAVVELAREFVGADTASEVAALWDLWVWEPGGGWQRRPQPLLLAAYGPDYDGGEPAAAGELQADLGFEHLFTGHAGLLGAAAAMRAPEHPFEAEFLQEMSSPGRLREYHEKTRENIRLLLDWVTELQRALPVETCRLWSEGEENFEARLDEILAVR
jgi:hypothetical protein